jgi:hypothetical protein
MGRETVAELNRALIVMADAGEAVSPAVGRLPNRSTEKRTSGHATYAPGRAMRNGETVHGTLSRRLILPGISCVV